MLEKINERIKQLKSIRDEKASVNAILQLQLKEIEEQRQSLIEQINSNLWVNMLESKELERLLIVQEELNKLSEEKEKA